MIRKQAEKLLAKTKLIERLTVYGKVFITGSYRMNMMCWNEIDLYIEDSEELRENWFRLVNEVFTTLKPYRFDGAYKADKLFLGCETDITGDCWNIDIWVRDRAHIENSKVFCDLIVASAEQNPELRDSIIAIKKELIDLNMYGLHKMADRHYHSDEIYRAVLEENIRTAEEFLKKYPK